MKAPKAVTILRLWFASKGKSGVSDCGCHAEATNEAERSILRIAFVLNSAMFVVGAIAAFIAQSMGLLADALDMLADAGAYAIALMAWHHGPRFKADAARLSGMLLTLLGIGVLAGVMWRGMTGSMPEGHWMMVVSVISLIVNATVLYLLSPFRKGEVHLRATWLFTQADVIANLMVMVSGTLVLVLHSPWPGHRVLCTEGGYRNLA